MRRMTPLNSLLWWTTIT